MKNARITAGNTARVDELMDQLEDRRMAYFSDIADIEVKRRTLKKAINDLIGLKESKLRDEHN
jgi:hypothetical protein